MQNLITEEEVRTKFVYEWLKSVGFQASEIELERRVTFQLGRGEFTLEKKHGRFDVLIKSSTGINLILFEVKAPEVKLDEETIDQAVSYARVLKGNMAPIVVITNSKEMKVFCSLSKRHIKDIDINKTMSGQFHFRDKDLEDAKSEAILSLSKDSYFLRCICEQLSSAELSRLSGHIQDSKKYCKELYIPLVKKPDACMNFILVSGPPQSGKTNYICNSFYEVINNKEKALFFRAKSIKKGIVPYLKDNVTGLLDSTTHTSEIITKKLISGNDITIFIDGLNEVSRSERDEIMDDIARIWDRDVRFVISCTDTFVSSIKYDCYDDFSDIFKNSETNKFFELRMPALNEEKYNTVISHYQQVYKTNQQPKLMLSTVNTVGKFYHLINSGHTPDDLDSEYKILRAVLADKCKIISQIEQRNCKSALLYLANTMANSTYGVSSSSFCNEFMGNQYSILPDSFKNSGILEVCDDLVEFYDETYRDILLIEQYSTMNIQHDEVLEKLSNFENSDISLTCTFKYLCFYNIPISTIFKLELNTQITMIESIISYIRNCKLANSHIMGMLLDLTLHGIKNNLISPIGAEEILYFVAEVCIEQHEISIEHCKTQYILGYCSSTIDLSSAYELEEHPLGFYNGQNFNTSIYNYVGLLFNNYLIDHSNIIFSRGYVDEIKLALELYNENALGQLEIFFSELIDYIFNYDSGMCAYGSYLNVEIDNFRESGSYETLVEAFQILLQLKDLLSNTSLFDDLIEKINGELSSSPKYDEFKLELT